MTIITLPTTLPLGQNSGVGQRRFDLLSQSESSGSQQTRLFGPPRWTLRLVQPDILNLTDGGSWAALLMQLRGRVNVLAAWDPARPAPRGTLRGSLSLSAGASQGATSMSLAGANTTTSWMRGSGYEFDSNADGLSDLLGALQAGTYSGVVYSRPSGSWGNYQKAVAATLGGSGASQVGWGHTAQVPVVAGTCTISADLYGATTNSVAIETNFFDSGGGFTGVLSGGWVGDGAWHRRSITGTVPGGSAYALIYIYMHTGTGAAPEIRADNVQLEAGSVATAYGSTADLRAPTVLAGDRLTIGSGMGTSQQVMCTAPAVANDIGQIGVNFEPPLRSGFSSSTAVAWDKPLAYYRQQTDASTWGYDGGGLFVTGLSIDLMEVWA